MDPVRLAILLVEDSDSDADLILRALRKGGFEVEHQRVENEADMRRALETRGFDLILSDYNLPGFSASGALELMHSLGLDLPFIVVSGKIGEETAVALMRAGAHDYVMKDKLARLPPAVSREIDEAEQRRQRQHTEVQRQRAETALLMLNEQLEARVEERTSELRQAMNQIIESEKLASLGVLVAGVSHELNTPIGNMVLAASALHEKLQAIAKDVASGSVSRSGLAAQIESCREASMIVERNGERASELIASFKRVAVDQTSQRRRRFDLRMTIQDSLNALVVVTRRAKVSVDLNIAEGLMMDSFPGHLEQIINNLVMNSVTHGFEGRAQGRISISAEAHDGMLELLYTDDGAGIAAHLQQKVFEPFYTTRMGQGGSGLGLSIVNNLVQAIFKGRLRLESAIGQGVKIYFSLPMNAPQ